MRMKTFSVAGLQRWLFRVMIRSCIALGLGTMVGWKRIVRTVGEKIGKTHLTYAQGASAELVRWPRLRPQTFTACRSPRLTWSDR